MSETQTSLRGKKTSRRPKQRKREKSRGKILASRAGLKGILDRRTKSRNGKIVTTIKKNLLWKT